MESTYLFRKKEGEWNSNLVLTLTLGNVGGIGG